MKLHKYSMIFFLLILGFKSFGQIKYPTQKAVRRAFSDVFKANKTEGLHKWTTWSVCNSDSAFYKIDTINFVSDESYYLDNNCCKTIDFNFSSKNDFYMQGLQACQEPTSITPITKFSNHYKITFLTDGQFANIVFTDYNSGKQNMFKVINIDKLEVHYKSDLTRIKVVRIK